jgi:hypothetical protein
MRNIKERIINTFATPYIPSIEIGNAILKYLLDTNEKLQNIYLMKNPHIPSKILIKMWKFAKELKKMNINEKDMIEYIKKNKNKIEI